MNYLRTSVIIVAAGKGIRFGENISKQFLLIDEKPILVYTLEKFQKNNNINEIILVLSEKYLEYFSSNISTKYDVSKIKIVVGGKERKDSVLNGLNALGKDCEIVLIHDAVRPLVSEDIINSVIEETYISGAAVPVISITDTIKLCQDNFVIKTIDRENLFCVQTPQGFKKNVILEAFKKADLSREIFTDDASVVELNGQIISTVKGDSKNIKITTKEDLALAEKYLRSSKC